MTSNEHGSGPNYFVGVSFDLQTSMHYHVRSTTQQYYPSDTKEAQTYEADIEYRFNDEGFRCDINMNDFEGKNVNLFLGCSNTLGIGVNLEDTWCWHVNHRHGGVMCNMGQGGGSAETSYRLLNSWIGIVKPQKVFMLSPPATRREFWMSENQPEIFGPRSTLPDKMIAEREIQVNRIRVVDAIENVCNKYNASFHYVYFRPIYETWRGVFLDYGRDGAHPGIKTHVEISRLGQFQ
jgi:hypothetical protein